MAKEFRTIKTGRMYRAATFAKGDIDSEARTVRLTFSSEDPCERWFGMEILDHSKKSADFSRIESNSCPVLVNHDDDDQVGIAESGEVKSGKGYATARFSKSVRAQEIFQDVQDRIRTTVSVGYQVNKMVLESEEKGKPAIYRATDWTVYEISLAPIPADVSVGTDGRSAELTHQTVIETEKSETKIEVMETKTETTAPATPTPAQAEAARKEFRDSYAAEVREIIETGRNFDCLDAAQDAIAKQESLEDFRKAVLAKLKTNRKAVDASEVIDASAPANESTRPARSIGELVTNNANYRRAAALLSGRRSLDGNKLSSGNSQKIDEFFDIELPSTGGEIRGLLGANLALRTTGDPATTSGGSFTSIEKLPGIVVLGQQPVRITQLIPEVGTTATTVRYIQENSFTNAAAAVAENGQLAEATWDLNEVNAYVQKIGVIGRVTEEFFEDYEQTQSYINNRLVYMSEIKVDNYLLTSAGGGTTPGGATNCITGLNVFTGINTQPQGADNAADAIYQAMIKILTTSFFQPDAIVLHPLDLQNFRLMKDKNGQYLYTGPFGNVYGQQTPMGMTLWGLPVVWSVFQPQGTALVGAFGIASQIWRRRGLTVKTTNSDASDFQFGRVAISVTTRLALGVYRPLAFCTVTGLN